MPRCPEPPTSTMAPWSHGVKGVLRAATRLQDREPRALHRPRGPHFQVRTATPWAVSPWSRPLRASRIEDQARGRYGGIPSKSTIRRPPRPRAPVRPRRRRRVSASCQRKRQVRTPTVIFGSTRRRPARTRANSVTWSPGTSSRPGHHLRPVNPLRARSEGSPRRCRKNLRAPPTDPRGRTETRSPSWGSTPKPPQSPRPDSTRPPTTGRQTQRPVSSGT